MVPLRWDPLSIPSYSMIGPECPALGICGAQRRMDGGNRSVTKRRTGKRRPKPKGRNDALLHETGIEIPVVPDIRMLGCADQINFITIEQSTVCNRFPSSIAEDEDICP